MDLNAKLNNTTGISKNSNGNGIGIGAAISVEDPPKSEQYAISWKQSEIENWRKLNATRSAIRENMTSLSATIYDLLEWKDIVFSMIKKKNQDHARKKQESETSMATIASDLEFDEEDEEEENEERRNEHQQQLRASSLSGGEDEDEKKRDKMRILLPSANEAGNERSNVNLQNQPRPSSQTNNSIKFKEDSSKKSPTPTTSIALSRENNHGSNNKNSRAGTPNVNNSSNSNAKVNIMQFQALSSENLRSLDIPIPGQGIASSVRVGEIPDIVFDVQHLPYNCLKDLLLLCAKIFRRNSDLYYSLSDFFCVVFSEEVKDRNYHFCEFRELQNELVRCRASLQDAKEKLEEEDAKLSILIPKVEEQGRRIQDLERENDYLKKWIAAMQDEYLGVMELTEETTTELVRKKFTVLEKLRRILMEGKQMLESDVLFESMKKENLSDGEGEQSATASTAKEVNLVDILNSPTAPNSARFSSASASLQTNIPEGLQALHGFEEQMTDLSINLDQLMKMCEAYARRYGANMKARLSKGSDTSNAVEGELTSNIHIENDIQRTEKIKSFYRAKRSLANAIATFAPELIPWVSEQDPELETIILEEAKIISKKTFSFKLKNQGAGGNGGTSKNAGSASSSKRKQAPGKTGSDQLSDEQCLVGTEEEVFDTSYIPSQIFASTRPREYEFVRKCMKDMLCYYLAALLRLNEGEIVKGKIQDKKVQVNPSNDAIKRPLKSKPQREEVLKTASKASKANLPLVCDLKQ